MLKKLMVTTAITGLMMGSALAANDADFHRLDPRLSDFLIDNFKKYFDI